MSAILEEIKLPSTWRWVRCQDVVDVRDGTHDTPTKTNFGIPLITSKNLTPQGLDFSNITYISEEDHQSIEKRSAVDDGDVLFAMIGTIGNPVIVKKDRRFSIKNVALFKLNKSLYYPPFFKELLNTSIIRKQLARNTKGGNQKFVSLSVLREMVIPLPPLEEQRRIAEILDRAEELRSKRRKAIAQLDTLTQAIFIEMFGDPVTNPKGWCVYELDKLVSEFRYGSSNKSQIRGKPALRIPNIIGGSIDLSDLKLVPVNPSEFERLQLIDGDILFVRTNGNPDFVGRCAVFDSSVTASSGFSSDEFIFASYLIRARLQLDKISPIFFRELMLGSNGRRELRSRSKTSAGQFNINTENLKTVPVFLPPLPLQQEFARRVEAVEKLKAAHRASLSELDALFASLQHRAFRGEL
jgi:type I restriction enzyme, S subunit